MRRHSMVLSTEKMRREPTPTIRDSQGKYKRVRTQCCSCELSNTLFDTPGNTRYSSDLSTKKTCSWNQHRLSKSLRKSFVALPLLGELIHSAAKGKPGDAEECSPTGGLLHYDRRIRLQITDDHYINPSVVLDDDRKLADPSLAQEIISITAEGLL